MSQLFLVLPPNQLTQPDQSKTEIEKLKKENHRLLERNKKLLDEIKNLNIKNPLLDVNKRLVSEKKDILHLLRKYRHLLSKSRNLCVCPERTKLIGLSEEFEKRYKTVTTDHTKQSWLQFKQNLNTNWTQLTCTPKNNIQTIANTFKCDECAAQFPEEHLRVRHQLKEHPKQTQSECKECHQLLAEKEVCICSIRKEDDHEIEIVFEFTPKNVIQCEYCDQSFPFASDLAKHQKEVHKVKNPFKCNLCAAQFPEDHLRVRHQLQKHPKQFECKDCHKMLAEKQVCDCSKDRNDSNQPVVTSNDQQKPTEEDSQPKCAKKFFCNACGKSWPRISTLAKHQKLTHRMEKPYKCDKCETRFSHYIKLMRHKMERHPRLEPYECKECNKKFDKKIGLQHHNYAYHKYPKNRYKCQMCSFETRHCTNYRLHLLRLHSENVEQSKKYVCDVEGCGKRFITNSDRSSHTKNVHTVREKNVECDFEGCHKMFKDISTMTRHKIYCHSDCKTFVCDWPGCDWAFKTNTQYENHKYVHLSEKTFKCTFDGCSKTFKHKTTRNNHYQRHVKKYVCDWPECDQRFAESQALLAHMNKHKNLRPFKCYIDDCQKDFYIKKQLDQHIRSFHNTKPIPTK